ncbi:MAG: coiled-coil domain-containing protein [Bacillus sp. (in: firmicutes)]
MNWKKHLIINSALFTLLSVASQVNAEPSNDELTEQLESVTEEASSVQEDIQTKTEEAGKLAAKKEQAYKEWQELAVKVADLEIQLYQQTSELLQIKSRISELQTKGEESKKRLDKRFALLSERLQVLQEQQSNSNIIAVLLESDSISDFVNRALAVSYIINSDQELMDSYEQEYETYTNLKNEAEVELAEMEKVQEKLNKTKADLEVQQQKKDAYMAELTEQYGWTMENIQSLQTEYAQLEQESKNIEEQIEENNRQQALKEQQQAAQKKNSSQSTQSSTTTATISNGGYDVRNISNVTAADLESMLTGHLSGYGSVFYEVGHSYGIDPAFLAAIAMSETGGNSNWLVSYNNVGGFIHNGPMTFNSIADSIHYMGSVLTRLYINDGLYTVEAIHSRYSPVGATNDPSNLNSNWVSNVYKFMRQAGVSV